ncbi:MAG: hypothetical protein WCF31_06435 [Candidatus Deferrimicrobiaceae bacterium]
MSGAGRGKKRKGRQGGSGVVRRDVLKGMCCVAAAVPTPPCRLGLNVKRLARRAHRHLA